MFGIFVLLTRPKAYWKYRNHFRETFWFFRLRFRQADVSACDSDSRFSLGPLRLRFRLRLRRQWKLACRAGAFSIKIGKSVEIDDTRVSFIDLSRFYRFHRFLSEDTCILLFIQKWKLISGKHWICWQLSCNWESKDQTIYYHFFKQRFKKTHIFSLKPALKSSSDGRYWPGFFIFPSFSRFRSATLSK